MEEFKIDDPAKIFGNTIDPNGPYQRREVKVEVVNGEERIIQIFHSEVIGPDGITNVINEIRYLCQGCRMVWLLPGTDALTWNEKILCAKCSKKAKIKGFLKPLWSPFAKFDEKK